MALELSPNPSLLDEMRALAAVRNDAELLRRTDDFKRALDDFFCEPGRLSAIAFTAVYTAYMRLCVERTGEAQRDMDPDDFARIRAAALALRRPMEPGARVH